MFVSIFFSPLPPPSLPPPFPSHSLSLSPTTFLCSFLFILPSYSFPITLTPPFPLSIRIPSTTMTEYNNRAQSCDLSHMVYIQRVAWSLCAVLHVAGARIAQA